jgi:hypothetical protein
MTSPQLDIDSRSGGIILDLPFGLRMDILKHAEVEGVSFNEVIHKAVEKFLRDTYRDRAHKSAQRLNSNA